LLSVAGTAHDDECLLSNNVKPSVISKKSQLNCLLSSIDVAVYCLFNKKGMAEASLIVEWAGSCQHVCTLALSQGDCTSVTSLRVGCVQELVFSNMSDADKQKVQKGRNLRMFLGHNGTELTTSPDKNPNSKLCPS
jgi:hypothetical protein